MVFLFCLLITNTFFELVFDAVSLNMDMVFSVKSSTNVFVLKTLGSLYGLTYLSWCWCNWNTWKLLYNFFISKNDTQDSKFSAWIPGSYFQCPVLKNLRLDPELSLWYVVALPPFMNCCLGFHWLFCTQRGMPFSL